jgi:hypothetical protein
MYTLGFKVGDIGLEAKNRRSEGGTVLHSELLGNGAGSGWGVVAVDALVGDIF